jgi:hypothetical protein
MGIRKQTIVLMIFAFFGAIWLMGATHEVFHVVTGKGANSICWDFGIRMNDTVQTGFLLWHTEFNVSAYDNLSEYHTWRQLNEKYAAMFLDHGLFGIMCMLIGIAGTQVYILYWRKD